jgi:hypothetical protein
MPVTEPLRLADLALRNVDPTKLLFEHLDPTDETWRPRWFEDAKNGIGLGAWTDGTISATVEARFVHHDAAVAVAITGYYTAGEQPADDISADTVVTLDNSLFSQTPDAERDQFAIRAVRELYPYLRAELQMLSGRLPGYPGISLEAAPRIARNPVDDED